VQEDGRVVSIECKLRVKSKEKDMVRKVEKINRRRKRRKRSK